MIRSRLRRPLESSHPHFAVRDPNARADFLLRSWPHPRCFRRGWGDADWLELDPPFLAWDAAGVSRIAPFELRPQVSRGRRPTPGQLRIEIREAESRIARGGLEGFWRSVPAPLRDRLAELPRGEWPVLQMAARDPALLDLVLGNLALGVALASAHRFVRGRVFDRANLQRELARCRQHDVLAQLGFPGRRSVRRLLQRTCPEAVSVGALLRLRGALHRGAEELRLGHLPRLNAGALALASEPACHPHVGPRLLRAVAASEEELREPTTALLLRDAVWMRRELGRTDAYRPASIERVRADHEEFHTELQCRDAAAAERRREREELRRQRAGGWREPARPDPHQEFLATCIADQNAAARRQLRHEQLAAAQRRQRERRLREPFPAAPIPDATGRFGVRARGLRHERELRAWGEEQRNCVAQYAPRIRAGAYFVYALEAPAPGTLGLVRSPGSPGGWRLEQVLGPRNRPLPEATQVAVRAWVLECLDARGSG